MPKGFADKDDLNDADLSPSETRYGQMVSGKRKANSPGKVVGALLKDAVDYWEPKVTGRKSGETKRIEKMTGRYQTKNSDHKDWGK